AETIPPWSPELQRALQSLLSSANPVLPAAVLPLVARWDKGGSLSSEAKALVRSLGDKLKDDTQADDVRAQVATSLIGVRQLNPEILPSVGKLLGSSASVSLQTRIVEALGSTGDPAVAAVLVEAFP